MPRLALLLALAALAPAATAMPLAGAVDVLNFAFRDATTATTVTTITLGEPVVWTGVSGFHTILASDQSFGTDTLGVGDTYTYTPQAQGAMTYVCTLHPSMRGVLVVV